MRTLTLVLLAAALSVPARANPMLDKCLPFAPLVCGLNELSTPEQFLACFETVSLKPGKDGQAACAEELAHARVHGSCGAVELPTLCGAVKPGENRTMNCLRKNAKKLGKDCRKALKDYDAIAAPKDDGSRKKGRGGVSAVRC